MSRDWTQKHIEELIKKTVDEYMGEGGDVDNKISLKYPPYIYHHPFTIPPHGTTGNMLTMSTTPSSLFVTREGYCGMEFSFDLNANAIDTIDINKPVGFYSVDNESNQSYLSKMDEFVAEENYDYKFNNPLTLYNMIINNQSFGFVKYLYIENYNVITKRAYFQIELGTALNLFDEDKDEKKNLVIEGVSGPEARGHMLYLSDNSKAFLKSLLTQLKTTLDTKEGHTCTLQRTTLIGRSFIADNTWANNINPDYFFSDYYKLNEYVSN